MVPVMSTFIVLQLLLQTEFHKNDLAAEANSDAMVFSMSIILSHIPPFIKPIKYIVRHIAR